MQNKTPSPSANKYQTIFEYSLLILIAAVIACKTTITQAPSVSAGFNDVLYNLIASTLLLFSAAAWFFYNITRTEFKYRFSGLEIAAAVFIVATVTACFFASNKRAAISDSAAMIFPMIMSILLVQLLKSSARIKILLYVIVAMGAVNVTECVDQFFSSNDMLVQQYKEDPNVVLERVNVEPGSYQHMLFEHRLYSKDVRGFFTTSNSAGSFFILALAAAVALVYEKYKMCTAAKTGTSGELTARCLLAAVIVVGILITHSKGVIASLAIVAVAGYLYYYYFRNWIARHKALAIIAIAAVIAAAAIAMAAYGISRGTLPGGNSLAVRWQYWVGAARMIAAHPLTGVGAGNFGTYYEHYKIPAALETVKDPHNFILSLLAQAGPLGLAGFLIAVAVPFWQALRRKTAISEVIENSPYFKRNIIITAGAVAALMCALRPLIMTTESTDNYLVMAFVIGWLYLLPVIVFATAIFLLSINEPRSMTNSITVAILLLGVAAVLIHNLVDFAIFEPGINLVLWACIAIVISCCLNSDGNTGHVIKPAPRWASVMVMACFGIILAYLHFEVRPVLWSSLEARSAMSVAQRSIGYAKSHPELPDENKNALIKTSFDYATKRLYAAAEYDPYSPMAPYQSALLSLEIYETPGQKDIKYLQWAQNRLLVAADRDKADFKNYEKLAEVLLNIAGETPKDKQQPLLSQAQNAVHAAIDHYPGSERLRFLAGQIADRIDQPAEALMQYKTCIEIEDSYRKQFEKMYPGRSVFSRLGQAKYEMAQKRIEQLYQLH